MPDSQKGNRQGAAQEGGAGREERIAAVLERAGADVVALQECTDLDVVQRLADRLSMEMLVGEPSDSSSLNLAILSRLPVRRWRNHRHPGLMLRGHLECEVGTESHAMPRVRIHCLHLAARGRKVNLDADKVGFDAVDSGGMCTEEHRHTSVCVRVRRWRTPSAVTTAEDPYLFRWQLQSYRSQVRLATGPKNET